MENVRSWGRLAALYAAALGVLYLILGFLELASGVASYLQLPLSLPTWIPLDAFGGFAAMVIASSYLASTPLWRGRGESLSYLLAATMLSAVFGVLYLLIMGADGLSALIAGEEWSWMEDVSRPEIWLFLLSIPLSITAWRKGRKLGA